VSLIVRPCDVDLSKLEVEFAHLRKGRITYEAGGRATTIDRRAQLDCPPFVCSRKLWTVAVERFHQGRARGQLRGTPFLVVTQLYRQLGGDFR
jgi:hypothetical protein